MSDSPTEPPHITLLPHFLTFAEAALKPLRTWLKRDGVPELDDVNVRLTPHGWEYIIQNVPDYWSLLNDSSNEEALLNLPETGACALAHWAKSNDRPFAEPDDESTASEWEEAGPTWILECVNILMRALVHLRTLEPSLNDLSSAYIAVIAETGPFEQPAPRRLRVPLWNLRVESTPVEISSRLCIVPFTLDDKNHVFKMEHIATGLVNYESFRYSHLQIQQNEIQNGVEHSAESLIEEVGHYITALRLTNTGHIGADVAFFINQRAIGNIYQLADFRVPQSIKPYQLKAVDLERVRSVNSELANGLSELTLALHRFNLSFTRTSPEDALIDLVVALESTLLAGVDQELKFRLAVRGAVLLADQRPAVETFEKLKLIYDWRSKIVHNGKRLPRPEEAKEADKKAGVAPSELPHICRELTRDILREFVLNARANGGVRGFAEALDGRVVASLRPSEMVALN
jgi:hypothetical protein